MDDKVFKARLEKLAEAAEVLNKLPSEVRLAAFQMLERAITGTNPPKLEGAGGNKKDAGAPPLIDVTDAETFFANLTHDKPADNAKQIAAYLYSQYGTEEFSVEDIRELAKKVGVTIPDRVDATLNATREEGKKLFVGAGKGKYKPTVHGESYFKKTYNVKKGTKQKTSTNPE
jgi:hypothetical protein